MRNRIKEAARLSLCGDNEMGYIVVVSESEAARLSLCGDSGVGYIVVMSKNGVG